MVRIGSEEKGGVVFPCKYCKARTRHSIKEHVEYKGRNTTKVICNVCKHIGLMYRNKEGKLVIDQTDIPERLVLMPHDLEYRQTKAETEEEIQHNKEIDEWLRSKNPRVAYDKKIKGKRYPR